MAAEVSLRPSPTGAAPVVVSIRSVAAIVLALIWYVCRCSPLQSKTTWRMVWRWARVVVTPDEESAPDERTNLTQGDT